MRPLLLALFLTAVADAQQLPSYKPESAVSGVIRALGNYHMESVFDSWATGFNKYQPGVRFEKKMLGTANAIAGLYLETADIALMGREIIPMESIAFRRAFRYDATDIAVATASYNVPLETFAFAIFVNKSNPLSRLTLPQVALLFGCTERGKACGEHTWGEVCLTGEWATRPVHLYGYETNTGLGYFFEQTVLKGGHLWNGALREYANVNGPNATVLANAGDLIVRDLSNDPGGIGFAGFGHVAPGVKALAVASGDGRPYVELTKATVASREYPLTRTVYFFINKQPGKPPDPKVREFLRYILSREGQAEVSRQDIYLPLTPGMAARELGRLQ